MQQRLVNAAALYKNPHTMKAFIPPKGGIAFDAEGNHGGLKISQNRYDGLRDVCPANGSRGSPTCRHIFAGGEEMALGDAARFAEDDFGAGWLHHFRSVWIRHQTRTQKLENQSTRLGGYSTVFIS
jgi:hypothetical protein